MHPLVIGLIVVGLIAVTVTKAHALGLFPNLPLWFQIGSLMLVSLGFFLAWINDVVEGRVVILVVIVGALGMLMAIRDDRRRREDAQTGR